MTVQSEIKVKSLKKAVDVLNCFLIKQPLGPTDISDMLGIYKSNAHDILTTYAALGYLSKDEFGRYFLGPSIMKLGRAVGDRYSFQKVASNHIANISELVGEVVYLSVPLDRYVYYLNAAYPANTTVHLMTKNTSQDMMHTTSSGKVMLANMPPAIIENYLQQPLEQLTEFTITDKDMLRCELKKIKACGYATDYMENTIGLCCIAVPLLDKSGNVQGAISISGPSQHFSNEKQHEFASILLKHAKEISLETL